MILSWGRWCLAPVRWCECPNQTLSPKQALTLLRLISTSGMLTVKLDWYKVRWSDWCHTEWSQCGRKVTATSPLPLLITFHLYSQWSSRFDNLKNIKLNMIWQIPSLVGNCKYVIHRGRCDDLWPNTSVMIHRPRGRIHSDDVWSASVMMSEFRLRAGSPPVSWY